MEADMQGKGHRLDSKPGHPYQGGPHGAILRPLNPGFWQFKSIWISLSSSCFQIIFKITMCILEKLMIKVLQEFLYLSGRSHKRRPKYTIFLTLNKWYVNCWIRTKTHTHVQCLSMNTAMCFVFFSHLKLQRYLLSSHVITLLLKTTF